MENPSEELKNHLKKPKNSQNKREETNLALVKNNEAKLGKKHNITKEIINQLEENLNLKGFTIKGGQIFFPMDNLWTIKKAYDDDEKLYTSLSKNLHTIKTLAERMPFLSNFTKYLDSENPDKWIESSPYLFRGIKIDFDINKIKEVTPNSEFYGSLSFGSREEGEEYGVLYRDEQGAKQFAILKSFEDASFSGPGAEKFYTEESSRLEHFGQGNDEDDIDYDKNISELSAQNIGEQLESFPNPICVIKFEFSLCQWEPDNDFMELTIYPCKKSKELGFLKDSKTFQEEELKLS